MTSPIDATGGAAAAGWPTSTAAQGSQQQTFSSDAFLQLLVAQLKYQDPTHPTDGTQFLAQTAQFQMVQQLETLSKQTDAMLAAQRVLGAGSLVGRTVAYDTDGTTHRGVVDSVHLGKDGPTLTVGGTEVPMTAVTDIDASASPPA